MAANPDDVSFGVFNQKSSGLPFEDLTKFKNARVVNARYDEPVGVGAARLNASLLHQNEEFYCQVDSHNFFAPEWDAKLVEMYRALEHVGRPIIAQTQIWHTPQDYENPSAGLYPSSEMPAPRPLMLNVQQRTAAPDYSRDQEDRYLGRFLEHYLYEANAFFTSASFVYEVSHVPFSHYFCEQELSALRACTRGYRIFATDTCVFSTLTKQLPTGDFNSEGFPDDFHIVKSRLHKNQDILLDYLNGKKHGFYGAPTEESFNQYVEKSGNDFRALALPGR